MVKIIIGGLVLNHKNDLKKYIYTDHGMVFYTMQFPTKVQNSNYLHRTYRTLTFKYM